MTDSESYRETGFLRPDISPHPTHKGEKERLIINTIH